VLTRPEFTQQWAGKFGAAGPIDSDWQLGSQVLWKNADGKVYVSGNVIALEPNKLLRFTVRDIRPELQPISGLEKDDITQTYALVGQGGHPLLSSAHGDFSKLAGGEKIYPLASAVWDELLPQIKELAEQ
jgi:uncharacterized protein YndB with AHSA1/START domain